MPLIGLCTIKTLRLGGGIESHNIYPVFLKDVIQVSKRLVLQVKLLIPMQLFIIMENQSYEFS